MIGRLSPAVRRRCRRRWVSLARWGRTWAGALSGQLSGARHRYFCLRRVVRAWVWRHPWRRVVSHEVGEKAWQVVLISVVMVLLWMAFILHFIARG